MLIKNLKIIILAAIVIFVIKAKSAYAQDYFIDSVNGNDNWDGKSQTFEGGNRGPWRTSNGPNWFGSFSGGDRILFKRGGVYSRLLATSRHQSSDGHPITFGAYGEGEKPIITVASNIISSWTDMGDGRYSAKINQPPVEVVIEDWNNLRKAKTAEELDPGDYFYDSTNKIIYYKPSSGEARNHEVRYGGAAGLSFWQKADNFIVQDLHFIGAGIYHGLDGPEPFKNIIIERCDFTGNAGIWLEATKSIEPYNGQPARDITIQDCTFRNARSNIYIVAQNHGTFERLTIRRNKFIDTDIAWNGRRYSGLKPDGSGGDIDGISIQNIRDSLIERNEISGGCYSGGIVIWFSNGFAGTGNIIRYNYIHDIDPSAIHYGGEDNGTSNVEIYGNIIENVGNSVYFYGGPSEPWGGINISRSQTSSHPSKIFNNVIYNADASFKGFFADYCVFENNISLYPRNNQHYWLPSGVKNNIFNNNIYFGINNFFNVARVNRTFKEWLSLTKQESYSQIIDPLFQNLSGNFSQPFDFKLSAYSPAIDAGADVGLTADFEGTPIPQGAAPDIGAFEYKSETPIYSSADINQDKIVNSLDFEILKTDFLRLTPNLGNLRSDINRDGQCTVKDLGILMSEWGK